MRDWEIHTLETPEHVLTELRKKLCRMHDIARTQIILPLYTLIDVLTVCFIATFVLAIREVSLTLKIIQYMKVNDGKGTYA